MPSVSEKQRRFMCSDMSRAKKNKKTRTGMDAEKLSHFCRSKVKK